MRFFIIMAMLSLLAAFASPVFADDGKWAGVDEAVVEKISAEHGREASEPLINTDKGDLLLFVFLLGGAAGGFAGGYYWRTLTERKPGTTG